MLGPRWQASGQPAPGPTDTDHREGIGLPSDPIQASRVRACARARERKWWAFGTAGSGSRPS